MAGTTYEPAARKAALNLKNLLDVGRLPSLRSILPTDIIDYRGRLMMFFSYINGMAPHALSRTFK